MENTLQNKKVLILGLGISGRSAAGFLLRRGANVTAVDKNVITLASTHEVGELIQQGLKTASPTEVTAIESFELVVVSPGIPEADPLYEAAKKLKVEVIGEIELACRFIQSPFLAITGTNGKTTVTLLVEHILNASGKKASALGNSGIALTSMEAENAIIEGHIIVAELSSYQLDTMHSKIIDAAVLLNITPDHLDRYGTMEAYAKSKFHIADCLKDNGKLFVEHKCLQEYRHLQTQECAQYGFNSDASIYCDLQAIYVQGNKVCDLPANLQNKATHDVENILAAFAVCLSVGVSPEQFMSALASFKKPAHRIEFVRAYKGIQFYDDSKGTNLDAVIKAVETMTGNVILIAGGVDKGAAYTPWIAAFADKVKCICAIGQAAPKIHQDVSHAIAVQHCQDLTEAVQQAYKQAQTGDTVLLSPGCSSFDMFRDYAHRGEEFQRIVNELV